MDNIDKILDDIIAEFGSDVMEDEPIIRPANRQSRTLEEEIRSRNTAENTRQNKSHFLVWFICITSEHHMQCAGGKTPPARFFRYPLPDS